MTIRITRQGIPPELREYEGTCGVCKTSIECLEKDGQYVSGSQFDGPMIRLSCPTCKRNMHAYPKKKASRGVSSW